MNGAELLIRTFAAGGIDTCFTNPGTSEIHLVAALDGSSEIRCILGLFEGVVTGAADGYGRMKRKPASTLLHLGPGLANGLANLHNAKRARAPIVNVIGQHATFHLRHDTPLASDIESLARPYSSWVRTCGAVGELSTDGAEAIAASCAGSGAIATLIVPSDVAWSESDGKVQSRRDCAPKLPASDVVEGVAAKLRSPIRTALLVAGSGLYGEGLRAAGRIAKATGAKLLAPYNFTRLERGAGVPAVERVAYILEQAKEQLSEFERIVLVGATPPVAYFAYPGKESALLPADSEVTVLAGPEEDAAGALQLLEQAVCAGSQQPLPLSEAREARPALPSGAITLAGLAAAIGALLPAGAIVVDESMTSGRGIMPATQGAPPHEWLGNTGGSIGIGLPLAIGAATACPERPVLCLTADGSAMYTLQGLWTMAREGSRVTVVVFANRSYAVLKREFSYLGIGEPGPRALDMFDIGRPDLDWVQLAQGMGVPAMHADSLESFSKALERGFANEGPLLIEVPL